MTAPGPQEDNWQIMRQALLTFLQAQAVICGRLPSVDQCNTNTSAKLTLNCIQHSHLFPKSSTSNLLLLRVLRSTFDCLSSNRSILKQRRQTAPSPILVRG